MLWGILEVQTLVYVSEPRQNQAVISYPKNIENYFHILKLSTVTISEEKQNFLKEYFRRSMLCEILWNEIYRKRWYLANVFYISSKTVDFIMALFTYGDGFSPHFHHQFLPCVITRQVFHFPDTVHADIPGLLTAQLTDTPFNSGSIAVRRVIFPSVIRQRIGIQHDFSDTLETVMVNPQYPKPVLVWYGIENTPFFEYLRTIFFTEERYLQA